MVVHLEVFTTWARRASPLHRYAPYWTGMVCVGVSGRRSRSPLRIIGVNLRNLRFNSLSLEHSRSTIGVDGGSPGGLYEVGEACLAPTQICPRRERYGVCGRFRAPFPFAPAHSRRKSAQSTVQFPVSGAFAINNRGRWSFTWRSLRSGRGMPRPYPDTPPTGAVLCAWAFQGAVPVRPCA